MCVFVFVLVFVFEGGEGGEEEVVQLEGGGPMWAREHKKAVWDDSLPAPRCSSCSCTAREGGVAWGSRQNIFRLISPAAVSLRHISLFYILHFLFYLLINFTGRRLSSSYFGTVILEPTLELGKEHSVSHHQNTKLAFDFSRHSERNIGVECREKSIKS